MQVPRRITTQTRRTVATEGYSRASGVNFEAITRPLDQTAAALVQQQRDRETFDLNKKFLEEANSLQVEFDKRMESAEIGAPNFSQNISAEFEERHKQFVAGIADAGYSPEAVRDLDLRLASSRQVYQTKALDFQNRAYRQKVGLDIDSNALSASQYAAANPLAITSVLDEFKTNLDLIPDLTAGERAEAFERGSGLIKDGARKAYALRNASDVIRLLDPKTARFDTVVTPGTETAVSGNAGTDSIFQSLVIQESGGRPGIPGPATKYGTAWGATQMLDGTARDMAKKLGVPWQPALMRDKTPAGLEYQLKLGRAYFEEGFAKYDGDVRKTLMYYHGGPDQKLWGKKTKAYAREVMQRAAASTSATITTPATSSVEVSVGDRVERTSKSLTGNPLLDLLTGPEQQEMLTWAQSEDRKRQAELKAATDISVENAINAYLSLGTGPTLDKAALVSVYGELEGEQKFAAYESARTAGKFIAGVNTLSNAAIAAQVEAARPKDTSSATLSQELRGYEAIQKAATSIMKQRADDPAAYVFQNFPSIQNKFSKAKTSADRKQAYLELNRAYDQLGIPVSQRRAWSEGQATELITGYQNLPPAQRIAQLEAMRSELGPLVESAFAQIAKGGAAKEGVLLYTLQGQPNYQSTVLNVMNGLDKIRLDPSRKPSPAAVNQAYRSGVGKALAALDPIISSVYGDAASGLYIQNGGDPTIIRQSEYNEALRAVVGGTQGNSETGIVTFAGTTATILPPGITKPQFQGWINRLTPGDLTKISEGKSPPHSRFGKPILLQDIVDEGVFVMLAPGTYMIKMTSDDKPLQDGKGKLFKVFINPNTVRGR